jgi:hypothetical protein
VALTPGEISLIESLKRDLDNTRHQDALNLAYYLGQQRVEQLGMAIPPNMRRFLVIVNWPRVMVDTIERRQNLRGLTLPGQEAADPELRELLDANNFETELSLFNLDRLIYGRAFLSVGANEEDPTLPLMRAESPTEVTAQVDIRQRRMLAAGRFYGTDENGTTPTNVTLYLPNETVWVAKDGSKWREIDRDRHMLGRVPLVMHLNRRMSGSWAGRSEMADIIPLTDAAARSMTNMQFAQEAHGIPRLFAAGVAQGDFVDSAGNPLPKWEAYFNAVWMNKSKDARVTQFTASDLKNFETALSMYGTQAATVTGFPARYFGLHTANPAAEGAIRADEQQLVEGVERQNAAVGTTVGWAAGLAYRLRTGEWVQGNRIRADWFDPGTPTYSQRADAISKMMAGANPVLSREGAWDELGWSEARKAKERAYFAAQGDPELEAMARLTNGPA